MNMIIPKTKNIYHAIKRNSYIPKCINAYLEANPTVDRRLGSLPPEWLKNVDKTEISKITQDVSEAFIDYSNVGNNFKDSFKNLKDLLQKKLKRNDIDITYAGSGALKNCHKLTVGDKSYALSFFKPQKSVLMGFGHYDTIGHGRGYEPQNIFTGYKRGSQGRWAKPFMSTLFSEKDSNGYILSKFIEKDITPKIKKGDVLASREFFVNTDPNFIAGRCIEAGGNKRNIKYISDRHIRANWSRFANIIDAHSKVLEEPIAQKMQARLLVAQEFGCDILSPEFVETLSALPKDERRVTTKLIRGLKKVRNLRTELEEKGEYKKYQKLLKEDFVSNFKFRIYSEDIIDNKKGYPRLLANELGVDNVPSFRELVGLSSILEGKANIKFNKYYPKEEAIKYLDNNYSYMRKDPVLSKIKREYKLEKEFEELERNYQKKVAENPAFDLSDLIY